MATKTRRQRTAKQEQKRADWDALKQQLEDSVTQVCESDAFKQALVFASKFHQYSLANTILIWIQCPHATNVAGYQKWIELNRQVRKGESSIRIWGHPVYKQNPETGEEEFAYWPMVSVFDISQTDKIDPTKPDPPTPPAPVQVMGGLAHSVHCQTVLTTWLTTQGISVVDEEMEGKYGYYQWGKQKIALRVGLSDTERLTTLVHEAAHFAAQHVGKVSAAEAETVAEGASFLVLGRQGLDTSCFSAPYIARFARDPKVLRQYMQQVTSTARLLDGVLDMRAYLEGGTIQQ